VDTLDIMGKDRHIRSSVTKMLQRGHQGIDLCGY
jgi:hypothetical protein